jgi:hypothetical protein
MMMKLNESIVKFKLNRKENIIRVFFHAKKLDQYIEHVTCQQDLITEPRQQFDKIKIDFEKCNLFLLIDKIQFKPSRQRKETWTFLRLLHEGITFWARSEMFEEVD